MQQILIYGAGQRGERICQISSDLGLRNISVLDSDPAKIGTDFFGYTVEPPDAIQSYADGYVLYIAIANESIRQKVLENLRAILGADIRNEISFYSLILKMYDDSHVIKEYVDSFEIAIHQHESFLFDCYNGLGLGGVETWTMNVCAGLIGERMEKVYILSDGGEYFVPDVLDGHIIAADIDHKEMFSVKNVKKIISKVIEMIPCVVVTCSTDVVMLGAYLIKKYFPGMVKVLSVVHNSHAQVYKDYLDFRSCTDKYIATTEGMKKELIDLGVGDKNVSFCVMPFSSKRELRRTYTLDKKLPIHIGFAGRFDGMEKSQKRMDLFLKLIKELVARKVAFSFELAGDGPVREEMEDALADERLGGRVKFLGQLPHEEILSFWERQDICVNMADYEGRCLSVSEAMGSGVVPVVTDTSGPREDIADGANGYIVPLGDYKTAVNRIEYLSKHRELLPEMGKKARDEVYPKSLMESHLEFWERLLLTEKAI